MAGWICTWTVGFILAFIRTAFNALFTFLSLAVDAAVGHAILDTALTWPALVTPFTSSCAVCAGHLDLLTLGFSKRWRPG